MRKLVTFAVCLPAVTLLLPARISPMRVTQAATLSSPVSACLPSTAGVDAGFDLSGVGRLPSGYPRLPRIGVDSAIVPPSLLKAVGWVESMWQQFNDKNVPLLSPDFGYGIMQITSGMAGATGDPTGLGTVPLTTQDHIGGDYLYNIAYGARMLAQAFLAEPAIDNRDPTILEDWYYALWAYNGWGYANNPNNPVFNRQGTPASNPSGFPYQERIYYWLEHPPTDASGHPLWTPMQVTLPSPAQIGTTPHSLQLTSIHREIPHIYGATYDVPDALTAMHASTSVLVHVGVYNTSGVNWEPSKTRPAFALIYHWVRPGGKGTLNYDPKLHGVDVADGRPVYVSHATPIGGFIRMAVRLTAPKTPGNYNLEWDMWGRQPGWFSYNSVRPGIQAVTVASPQATIPPYIDPPAPVTLRGPHAWFVTLTTAAVPPTLISNQSYSETALLFNPGSSGWGIHYRIALVGSQTAESLPVEYVAACRTVPIPITGTAPATPGNYTQIWRLRNPDGKYFGPDIRVQFTVSSGSGSKRTVLRQIGNSSSP